MSNRKLTKEAAFDIAKCILQWAAVTAGAFLYWMFVLLLLSIFLMNIWKTSIEELMGFGIFLTVITSLVYLGMLLRRKFK